MSRERAESRSRPVPSVARSVLFVPGDDERKLAKAGAVAADALIIDLEDAVADQRKDHARELLARAVPTLSHTHRVYVRLNSSVTGRTAAEVLAAAEAGAAGVIPTKVTSADEVRTVARMVAEHRADLGIVPLIETAAAVVDIDAIARAPGVERLAFGIGDLTHDLGLARGDDPGYQLVLDHVRARLVLTSRAAGLAPPLDGPSLAVRDQVGFEPHCVKARGMGFAGVLCLHPDQVEVVNRVFTPTAEQVRQARRVVDAFWGREAAGQASIVVDDIFVDYPIADAASDLLARVTAIDELSNRRERLRAAAGDDRLEVR